MTMMQKLWPRATKKQDSVHMQLVWTVMDILNQRRAQGATTGFMMVWVEMHKPDLAGAINARAPKGHDKERVQYFKTLIGHALDELQEANRVHCDEVGKRVMDGDVISVPVWRTVEDWQALRSHCRWMLRASHISQPRPYAERQRRLFENLSKSKTQ